jgi:hypothetical protein
MLYKNVKIKKFSARVRLDSDFKQFASHRCGFELSRQILCIISSEELSS